jgi:8-oxo-dGTP diphosphatase
MPRPTILVVAAVIIERGRVLITQRSAGSHLAGKWEFPGGKVEDDEDPRDALARELREELGIEARAGDVVDVAFHRYPIKTVLIVFYRAHPCAGSPAPRALEVDGLRWLSRDELDDSEFPPADASVLAAVRALLG